MDNLDGLAAAITAVGSIGVLALGVLNGRPGLAAGGAALAGASLGLLVLKVNPAFLLATDTGGVFLGFVLAAMAAEAGGGPPGSIRLVVPLLIVGLPLTDSLLVTVGRLRHGRPPFKSAGDHLSHRLTKGGLSPGRVIARLAAVEAVMAALAVVTGYRVLAPGWAALAGGVMLGALVRAVWFVPTYPVSDTIGLPRLLVWGGIGVVVVLAGLATPAAWGAFRARSSASGGEAAGRAGLDAFKAGNLSGASADFSSANADFAQAAHDLHGPLTSVGLAYPVLSSNLQAARTVVSAGTTLATVGAGLANKGTSLRVQVRGGAVPVAALAGAAPSLRVAATRMQTVSDQVSSLDRTYLTPQVSSALTTLGRELPSALRDVQSAAAAATEVPPLLGADGPRHYFLAVQNNAESRATGGFIGNFGELVADQGRLHLAHFGRIEELNTGGTPNRVLTASAGYLRRYSRFDPAQTWQNVNLSPDFLTVGEVIAGLYPQSGGDHIDGVIAVDPAGLAGLLQLTGPITVPDWPVPITSANVVQVTLHDAYLRFDNQRQQRVQFLGEVGHAAFDALSQVTLPNPTAFIQALDPAVRQRHLQVYSTRPAEESYLAEIGAAGAMPPVVSDSLAVTTQNGAGNKIDYYLRRQLTYQAEIDPGGLGPDGPTSARVRGHASIAMDNTAPASGLPASVIGPYEPSLQAGENRSFVTVYSRLGLKTTTLDQRPTHLDANAELGREAYSSFIDIAARSTATLDADLTGTVPLLAGGWYALSLPAQPLLAPDHANVSLAVAPGWKVVAVRGGATITGSRTVRASLGLATNQTVYVQMAKAG
ncbi:MAG: hypothetical protein DLM54_01290 [Acidimicrobiales bacterium]|nr:MAG: hypothetical protein DLM54_01290 [Acidimicrobiales bacterium]